MAFGDALKASTKTSSGFGGAIGGTTKAATGFNTSAVKGPNLSTLEGLSEFATTKGLGAEVQSITNPAPMLSPLHRLSALLGSFNPANALLNTTEEQYASNPFNFSINYFSDVGKGFATAITGKDYQGDRKTFADIAEKAGIENKVAKFGIGFIGDVLLDPSTYFGAALARGIGAGVKGTTNISLKGIGTVAPKTEVGLRLAGEGIKDAFGKALRAGYKSTPGAVKDVLTFLSKRDRARLGIATSNLNRLGIGTLTKGQQDELAVKLISGKRAEFVARNATADQFRAIAKGKIPPELESKILEYSFMKETLADDPARALLKYVDRRTGDLPEVLGRTPQEINALRATEKAGGVKAITRVSTFSQKGDSIVTEIGFDDAADAQLALDSYRLRRKAHNALGASIRADKAMFKDEKALDMLLADTAAATTREGAGQTARETMLESVSDPKVREVLESQMDRSKRFAAQLGLENPYETYFPFIKKDKLEKFLKDISGAGIKVGDESYRKQFKNLLTNESLELDPAKAFFTSEASQVTDRMTRTFLEGFTSKYGKPLGAFKTLEDARRAGYQVVKEKGIFGKDVGYAKEFDAKVLSDLITPEFQTISMLAKATGFDAITNLFKRSVTGLFLPFHVRNFASGLIQNFEAVGPAALNPKAIAAGQKMAYLMARGKSAPGGIVNVAGKPMKFSALFNAFRDRFGSDTFYQNDFLAALDNGSALKAAVPTFSKGSVKETLKTGGLGADAIPFRVGRAIGQFIEHQQKATAYLAALNQGMNIPDALAMAEKAGFDYRNLTAFESQIMRRLVPFYSFTRKNIELQLRTLGENPQRINQVLAFFNNAGELGEGKIPAEEKEKLPFYLKNSLGIKLEDTPEGLKQYISSFGTPVEAFAQLFNENPVLFALSQMNPVIKAPIEIGIGKDSFRQRDLKDVYDAREYKNAPQVIKDLLDIKEGQKDILDKNKDGKLEKVGERTVYVADPVRLLIARSLFTSRGVTYLDQIFGGDLQGLVKYLKLTTGIKPQQVDLEMIEGIKERDMKRALEDLLVKTGNAAQFTRTFVPKD